MDDKAAVLFEPRLDFGCAVSTIVVEHQMQERAAGKLPVDPSKELQEFLMPVSLVTVPNDFALQ